MTKITNLNQWNGKMKKLNKINGVKRRIMNEYCV